MTKKQTTRLSLIAIAVILVLLLGIVSVMTLNVSTDTAYAADPVNMGNGYYIEIEVDGVEWDYSELPNDNPIVLTAGQDPSALIIANIYAESGNTVGALVSTDYYYRTQNGDEWNDPTEIVPMHVGHYKVCYYATTDEGETLADKVVIAEFEFSIQQQVVQVMMGGVLFYYTGNPITYVPTVNTFASDFDAVVTWTNGQTPVNPGTHTGTVSLALKTGSMLTLSDYYSSLDDVVVTIEARELDVSFDGTVPYTGEPQCIVSVNYAAMTADESSNPSIMNAYASLANVYTKSNTSQGGVPTGAVGNDYDVSVSIKPEYQDRYYFKDAGNEVFTISSHQGIGKAPSNYANEAISFGGVEGFGPDFMYGEDNVWGAGKTISDRIVVDFSNIPGYNVGGELAISDTPDWTYAVNHWNNDTSASVATWYALGSFKANEATIGQDYTFRVQIKGNDNYEDGYIYLPFTVEKIKTYVRPNYDLDGTDSSAYDDATSYVYKGSDWEPLINVYQYKISNATKMNSSMGIVFDNTSVAKTNVGTYDLSITFKTQSYIDSYEFVIDEETKYVITKATLTPHIALDTSSQITYGTPASYTLTGVDESDMLGTGEGKKAEQNIVDKVYYRYRATALDSWGTWTLLDDVAIQVKNVGLYELKYNFECEGIEDNGVYYVNYESAGDSEVSLQIDKKALTLTPDNKEVTYGTAFTEYTVSGTGWAYGEGLEDLGGSPVISCAYDIEDENNRAATFYYISISGYTSSNYEITQSAVGTLTVNPKPVTYDVVAKTSVYGDAIVALTATIHEGSSLVSWDDGVNIDFQVWEVAQETPEKLYIALSATSPVGEYDIIAVDNDSNYSITINNNVKYTITAKTIVVTPDGEQGKSYGDADTDITYTTSATANNEVIVLTGALSRAEGENFGTYEINLGTLALTDAAVNSNYVIALNESKVYYSIAKVDATWTAPSGKNLTYNGSAQELVNAPTNVVGGAVKYSTDNSNWVDAIPQGTNQGEYTVYVKVEADGNHNNNLLVSTKVTIKKVVITITPYSNQCKTYGDSDGTINYITSETVNNEEIVLTGALSRAEGENYAVSGYTINIGTLALTDAVVNSNYEIVLDSTPVQYMINKRTLAFDFEDTFVYNGQSQKPVVENVEGLQFEEKWGTDIDINWTDGATTDAGSWAKLNFEFTGAKANNYTHASFGTSLTITARPLTVTWYIDGVEKTTGASLVYNATEHIVTAVAGNTVNSDVVTLSLEGRVNYTKALSDMNANVVDKYYTAVGSSSNNYKIESALTNRTFVWSISKANYDMSGVAFENAEKVYNGTEQGLVIGGTLPTGLDDIQVTVAEYSEGQTNVGSKTITVTFSTTSTNYNVPSSMEATITITKANYDMSDVAFENAEKVYNGTEQGLTIVGTLPTGADSVQVTVAYSEGQTNVGSKTITATFSTTSGNYNAPNQMEATITIVAKEVVVTIVDPTSLVYNNTEKTITATYNDVDEDPIAAVITYDEVDRINWTGTAFKAYVAIADTNYVVKADEAYTIENGKAMKSYTITKATYDMTGVMFDDAEKVYNGTEQGLLVGGTLPTGLDGIQVTVASYSEGQTNVGSKTITATFATTSTNYNVPASMEATLTINPKKVTLAWDNNTFEFDGNNHSVYATVGGTINNEEVTVTAYGGATNCRNANDGSIYETTALTLSDSNYTLTGVENVAHLWTITPREITVTYSSQHKEVTYGDTDAFVALGTEMGQNNYYLVAALGAGDSIYDAVNIAMMDNKNEPVAIDDETPAGRYNVVVTEKGNTNYIVSFELGDEAYLLVNKATLTVAVSPIANIVYGNSITVPTLNNGFTVTGWKNDDTDALIKAANVSVQWINKGNFESFEELVDDPGFNPYTDVLNEQPEEYGTYYLVVAVGGLDNYEDGAFAYTSYRITKAIYDMSGITFANINVVYDGTAKTATISGQLPDGVTVAYENNTRTVVGSQTATAKFTGDAENYEPIDDITCTITITARPITITADAKTSVYGSQFVALTAKLEGGVGAGDQEADLYVLSKAAGNVAGAYAITVTPANNANYAITVVNGTYTITAKPITVTADNKGSVYGKDIVALTATLSENALVGEDTAASVFTLSTTATKTSQPGEYPITVVLANNANYDVTVVNGKYTISEAAPVVNEAGVKEYNKEITIEEAVKGVSVTDLFKNAKNDTAETKEVVAKVGNASIAFNAAAIAAIGAADNISLKVDIVEGENIGEDAPKGALMVFNISLEGATFEDGTAVVEVPFDGKVPTGKEAKVFYVDENGKRTAMKTTYVDGVLAFETNHFSQYIVTYELTTATIAGIIVACVVVVAGIIVAVILVLKKKKGNGGKKDEEKKAEDKVDVEETKAEEAAPASEEAPKDAE